jgi:hypothetical protein
MTEQENLKLSKLKKVSLLIPPILLIITNIFLFGPYTIYRGNIDEMAISLSTLLGYFSIIAIILFIILNVIGIFLSEQILKRYISILFILGVLLWFQGNILAWNYGIIGKADIDWTRYAWRGWVDSAIWILVIAYAVFFFKKIYGITRTASIALISLQTLFLAISSIQHPQVWKNKAEHIKPPEEIFEFSSTQNVIHIILDELQSDVFQEIIEKDTNYYYNVFDGFTFFKETVGSFPTTIMSVPAFYSEEIYHNDKPIWDFVDSVYIGKTIPNVLAKNGFDVDLAAEQKWYGLGQHTIWYNIPVPYGVSNIEYEFINSAQLMGLVFFRYSPHFLKNSSSSWLLNFHLLNIKETESYEAMRHLSQREFLQDMIDNMSVNRSKPVYKYIHLTTTHWPAVMNINCEYTGKIRPWNWNNIKIQVKCSLDHFINFITRLKQLGIYDASLIVIHADHGYWRIPNSINQVQLQNLNLRKMKDFQNDEDFAQKVCSSLPLLMVKLPNSKSPLKTSTALTAITDIPSTITSALKINADFKGRSVFDIKPEEKRERKYYYYYELNQSGDDYFDRIDEYSINGSARDKASWRFISTSLPPGTPQKTKKIDFGTPSAAPFLQSRWGTKETDPKNQNMTYQWALGNSAWLSIPLPKTQTRFTANVKSLFPKETQSVTVKVDGQEIGSWKNSTQWEWEQHSLTIPANDNRPSRSNIEFVFSIYRQPDQQETRLLALLFESITFEEEAE